MNLIFIKLTTRNACVNSSKTEMDKRKPQTQSQTERVLLIVERMLDALLMMIVKASLNTSDYINSSTSPQCMSAVDVQTCSRSWAMSLINLFRRASSSAWEDKYKTKGSQFIRASYLLISYLVNDLLDVCSPFGTGPSLAAPDYPARTG